MIDPILQPQLNTDKLTRRYRIYGIVQGVGFRPVTARHAETAGVKGVVSNKGSFVEITAQGSAGELSLFEELIRTEPPKRAVILKIDTKNVVGNTKEYDNFEIAESEKKSGEIFVSPDIAICDECAEELFDRKNRRYLHPFINCTCCGPRLTILESLPYDRERTSMKEFAMCDKCADEYYDPATRRFDAQPVCCNDCGPEVYAMEMPCDIREGHFAVRPGGNSCERGGNNDPCPVKTKGLSAITRARQVIASGGIVAIKGIGGFHLCCDGTNEEAVKLLRQRKNRPYKPFALMMKNMDTVRRECDLSGDRRMVGSDNSDETEDNTGKDRGYDEALIREDILTGHQKPILLMKKNKDQKTAFSVAPGNPKIGVMLPYAPVHLLLFDLPDDGVENMPDVLVMTSGNVSGAPICRDDAEAKEELGNLCDLILSHNRKIRVRADDSVMDMYMGKPYMIRRSRGYAPLPFMMSENGEERSHQSVLAIGGELKNTFCIAKDTLFYPSAYVGDLADLRTVNALKETVDRFETLLETKPEVVVCDMHPGYNSVAVAKECGAPVIQIQHHYAHVLSCMAENDYRKPVIGVSFDGTGYGTDGTIWGGEIMLADLHGFSRCAHIAPFDQPGGDASSREGWRIAASMIYRECKDREKAIAVIEKLNLCTAKEAGMIFAMADRGINTVRSTSAGRLFDAVSAVLGIKRLSSFEGEASTALQFAAEAYVESRTDEGFEVISEIRKQYFNYCVDLNGQKLFRGIVGAGLSEDLDWAGLSEDLNETDISEDMSRADCSKELSEKDYLKNLKNPEEEMGYLATDVLFGFILSERIKGTEPRFLAYAFHVLLADMINESCMRARKKSEINTVALSGGCFQNTLLLSFTEALLERNGFLVLKHSMIPPNDGGIAIGQALFGMYNRS